MGASDESNVVQEYLDIRSLPDRDSQTVIIPFMSLVLMTLYEYHLIYVQLPFRQAHSCILDQFHLS
jgi:hypothetical protein